MTSTDKPGLDRNSNPVEQGAAGGDVHDDRDETLLVIRVQERQLMWVAVGILAFFVVIQGIGLLTMGSAGDQNNQPPVYLGGQQQQETFSNSGQSMSVQGGSQRRSTDPVDTGGNDPSVRSSGSTVEGPGQDAARSSTRE